MRELTIGKFVVKQEHIKLLETIGEGVASISSIAILNLLVCYVGEFGIVYKAKLSFPGRLSREVAIKTLKGYNVVTKLHFKR